MLIFRVGNMTYFSHAHIFVPKRTHLLHKTNYQTGDHNGKVVYSDIFKVLGVQKAYFHNSLNVVELCGVPQGRLLPFPRPSKACSGHASGDGQTNSSLQRKYPGFKFSLSYRRVQLSQGWTKNTKSVQKNQTIETLGRCFSLKDLLLWGKPAAMLWTALWRCPCAEELNLLPAAREQEGLPTTMWLGVEEDYPGRVEPWDDCSLAK